MKQEHLSLNAVPFHAGHTNAGRQTSPHSHGQPGQGIHRAMRIAVARTPARACSLQRALRAAVREAELAAWISSGGDYLTSMHQPVS